MEAREAPLKQIERRVHGRSFIESAAYRAKVSSIKLKVRMGLSFIKGRQPLRAGARSTNAANASRNRLQSADAITERRVSAQRFKWTAEISTVFSTAENFSLQNGAILRNAMRIPNG